MNVLFRVDASKKIGIGHVMRCLALSEELIKKQNNCYFLSKIVNKKLIEKIKNANVTYKNLRDGLSQKNELEYLIKFSKKKKIDWVVTDHYDISSEYIKKIKCEKIRVLSLDDISRIHYYSDVVVNQNIGSEKLDYSTEEYTKLLLGTKYTLLRNELLKRNKKRENKTVKNLLITFGGNSHLSLIIKILKALNMVSKEIRILVVTGIFENNNPKMKYFAKEKNINIIKAPSNMADIYLLSDIAINAGGSSCYELAYYGIPNIVIALSDNQINVARELNNKNISICVGRVDEFKPDMIQYEIKKLINNDDLRRKMSENGKNLIDGKGKKRVVNFMEKNSS